MKRKFSCWQCCLAARLWAALALCFLVVPGVPGSAGEPDWGSVPGPTAAPPQSIGGYTLGCLEGGVALASDGPGYQVMRPSRSRYFGHPDLIGFVRWLGNEALAQGRSGILIGDLTQPRGGPMTSGHASHQSGLDVDVWFLWAPDRALSLDDRETLSAVPMVSASGLTVGEDWTADHLALLRAAASYPRVDRIFVNAAIKQELCKSADAERNWLARIRPWWGHDHHFHVRLACPAGDESCVSQAPPPPGDGCGEELAWWFSSEASQALADQRKAPRRTIAMADLPAECEAVYHGSATTPTSREAIGAGDVASEPSAQRHPDVQAQE
jgi:penicillin-insensitive murein DD-endopeptidase